MGTGSIATGEGEGTALAIGALRTVAVAALWLIVG